MVVLDPVCWVIVFRAFYIVQALIIAAVCAVLPYIEVRDPVTLITRLILSKSNPPQTDAGIAKGRLRPSLVCNYLSLVAAVFNEIDFRGARRYHFG